MAGRIQFRVGVVTDAAARDPAPHLLSCVGTGGQSQPVALTEQVIPGHVCLLLALQRVENEHPVMVKVSQQLFAVERDPTAALHQVPAGKRGGPFAPRAWLWETRSSLLNPLKILSSHSLLVSVYFPFLEILFLSLKKKFI